MHPILVIVHFQLFFYYFQSKPETFIQSCRCHNSTIKCYTNYFCRAHQWVGRTRQGNNLMMLHADMALLHRFRVRGSRNEASCKSTSRCSKSRTTSRIVCIILYNVCIVILKVGTIFRSPTEHTVDNKARKLLLKHISLHSAVVECLPKD